MAKFKGIFAASMVLKTDLSLDIEATLQHAKPIVMTMV